jgi:16S rRNA (guanine527-N7)-methyltransferase
MPTLTEQAASLLDMQLTDAHEAAFAIYARELVAWNAQINLTAITDEEGIRVRHFLDSLTIVKAVPMREGLRLIDVGTGAGFPGLPLKIVYPEIHVTLLEATGKKIAFLQRVIDLLKLKDVETLHARAEEAGQMPAQRESYDLVVARSVARLPALLEYLLPLVNVGGHVIAMKGRSAHDEVNASGKALSVLGGRLKGIKKVQLPGVDEAHYLVVAEKIAATPAAYPRKPGIPTQKPIQ